MLYMQDDGADKAVQTVRLGIDLSPMTPTGCRAVGRPAVDAVQVPELAELAVGHDEQGVLGAVVDRRERRRSTYQTRRRGYD